jgi:enamine deaminase RidA (YjgF/YER057c/UK114 family)
VIKHAGGSLKDVVKMTGTCPRQYKSAATSPADLVVFLKDMDDFPRVNAVFERIIPSPKPARSCIQVARNPADVPVEIEAIARAP